MGGRRPWSLKGPAKAGFSGSASFAKAGSRGFQRGLSGKLGPASYPGGFVRGTRKRPGMSASPAGAATSLRQKVSEQNSGWGSASAASNRHGSKPVRRFTSIWPLTHEARLVWPCKGHRHSVLGGRKSRRAALGACPDALTQARGQPRACEPRLRRFEVVLTDSCLVAEVGEKSPMEGALGRQNRRPLNEATAETVLVVIQRAELALR